jgi:hypothetical protein
MKQIMKTLVLASSSFLIAAITSHADSHGAYPSLPSKVLSTYAPAKVEKHSARTMADAANAFLDSLDDTLRKQAALPFDSPEKAKWTNVPPRGPQGGVRLGDLDESQLKRACDFLAAVLSEQGYGKARNIPLADDRLLDNGKRRPGFGAEDYWLAIFGEPSPKTPWAVQLDGHHLALNLAFRGSRMCMSPSFIGTQPWQFALGDDKVVPMRGEAGAAHRLVNALTAAQKKKAVLGNKRGKMVAGANKDGFVPEPVGLPCKELSDEQRKHLAALLRQYVGDLPNPHGNRRMKQLTGEIAQMTFSWNGPLEARSDVSYRLQGPSLIIEYSCQDLGGDPLNHIHSIYRDPTNEYGVRLGK